MGYLLSAALALLLTITIIRCPEVAFSASLEGLKIWFDIVLPTATNLLRILEILMGPGVVHFIGVLWNPSCARCFWFEEFGSLRGAMGLASRVSHWGQDYCSAAARETYVQVLKAKTCFLRQYADPSSW